MPDTDETPPLGFDAAPDIKPQSFAPAEMITCDACLRANPPTRANCLYCGGNLPANGRIEAQQTAQAPQADGQSIDPGQADSAKHPNEVGTLNNCFVVLAAGQTVDVSESTLAEIAELLHLGTSDVQTALALRGRVLMARATTPPQAALLADKLRGLGIGVDIFRVDRLNLEAPPRKVRALELSDKGLAAMLMSGERVSMNWDDLVLIVTGRLTVNRVEVEERRRRGRAQPLGSRELFSDEPVVDLYGRADGIGCRISASSFDFSCLGNEKAMTAFENFATLVELLRRRAPNVEVADSYRSLRAVLANVWPLEAQTRKGEWRRSGAGKVDVSTVTTTANEIQFNGYSRLCQQVKLQELEGGR